MQLRVLKKQKPIQMPSGSSTLNSEEQTGDARPLYVKSRYGFNAGIGIDYDLSAVHLTFDINLNFGINSGDQRIRKIFEPAIYQWIVRYPGQYQVYHPIV